MLHLAQQLTLKEVFPIDSIQGPISEGPWDCLWMLSEALEFHLEGKRL